MTRHPDPARDDAGIRLRTARLRRGLTQTTLADLACLSPTFISMIETGQRELTRLSHVVALAAVLKISPLYLADGRDDPPPATPRPAPPIPFPARTDPRTLTRHHHLAHRYLTLAHHDTRTAGDWLRRLARDPTVNPWLLLDQLPAKPPTLPTAKPTAKPTGPTASFHATRPGEPGRNGQPSAPQA